MTEDTGTRPYSATWVSCDGFYFAEIKTVPPDEPYPAMVAFEITFGEDASCGGTLTADDTEDLIAHLGAAAGWATYMNKRASAAASVVCQPPGEADET